MSAYPLYFRNVRLGDVDVSKMGLYYTISSHFRSAVEGIYILWAQCGGTKVRIGICVPAEVGYTLSAKIPVKRFGSTIEQFYLEYKTDEKQKFFPLYTDRPARYLPYLGSCCFSVCDGIPGLMANTTDIHPTEEDWSDQRP